jgi:double-stranded uracil-DNA glycosylase
MTILPDILTENLKIIFCGTAAGNKSAQVSQYYAGRGNKFWPILYQTGLTPRLLSPHEFRTLPQYGLGLTDLAQRAFGSDASLKKSDYDVPAFKARMLQAAPQAVAFNGKNAAKFYYGRSSVAFGLQPDRLGEAAVFVLPSTSGAANGTWDAAHWHALAAWIKRQTENTP